MDNMTTHGPFHENNFLSSFFFLLLPHPPCPSLSTRNITCHSSVFFSYQKLLPCSWYTSPTRHLNRGREKKINWTIEKGTKKIERQKQKKEICLQEDTQAVLTANTLGKLRWGKQKSCEHRHRFQPPTLPTFIPRPRGRKNLRETEKRKWKRRTE